MNFALLAGAESISKLFAFAAFTYLARVLGATRYGELEFTLALVFFFSIIVDCGQSTFSAREVAKDPVAAPRLAAHIIFTRLVLACGAFALLTLVAGLLNVLFPLKYFILLYGSTLFVSPLLLGWAFQGRELMKYVALASVLRWSMFGVGVFVLVRAPDQMWFIPLIEATALVCVAVFYFVNFRQNMGSLRQHLNIPYAFSVVRQALPIGASEMVWALKMYGATVMLELLIGGPEVGWFAAAHRIVAALHTFVFLYYFNLLPSIARTSRGTLDGLQRLLGKSLELTAWAAVFIGIVGSAFAEPLIALIYGSQYHASAIAFRILIWLIPFTLLSGHYRYTLIAYNRQQFEFLSAAVGAASNLVLNFLLIPAYGLLGAAMALLISEGLIGILAYWFTRRTITSIPILAHLVRPVFAGVVLALVLYLVPPANLWLGGALAALGYVVLLSLIQPNLVKDVRSLFIRN